MKSDERPAPRRPQRLLLLGIFLILTFQTLYFASAVVLPIILAVVLYLLLQPSMRALAKLRIPKAMAALTVILMLFGGITGLAFALSGPVSVWVGKIPEAVPRLEEKMSFLTKPLATVQRTSEQVEKLAESPGVGRGSVTVKGPTLRSLLVTGTQAILTGVLTLVLLLFFLLISGDQFLRRLVESLPTFADKKKAVEISNEIERHISGYLLTISLINAVVGVATGIAVYLLGLSDPILWGTVAFLLNYVLILGPITCGAIIFLAGLLSFDTAWQAMLPAGAFAAIHFVESSSITPILLARRLTLNPVIIIVSLVFWYSMWGVAGAFLAVPLLGTFKIICDRVGPLMVIGHFLGTEARS